MCFGNKQYTKGNGTVIACIDIGFSRCSCSGTQSMSECEVFKEGISIGRFKTDVRGIYVEKNSFNRCTWKYENVKINNNQIK